MTNEITKAVFPVAGLGTRFLPVTKANPKEMLPIVDKPLIQYAVEEAVNAGIRQLIFVTSSSKHAIENHFDSNFELEFKLAEIGKNKWLEIVRNVLPEGVSCVYVRQPNPLGLGHAILCVKEIIGKEPFAVLLADDLIDNNKNYTCLRQMLNVFDKVKKSILAVQPVLLSETEKYGIVGLDETKLKLGEYTKITKIVEKPHHRSAPSRFASIGRYILTPDIFSCLEKIIKKSVGEIQLADGIDKLLINQDVYGYRFYGKRYDCGSKLGYLEATVEYGMKHHEVGQNFIKYLTNLTKTHKF
ncbi:MAG: UTP--glucose-1-phosphate uridylyltransferase GalU [Coxiellaceae bacterium]|jgi:UTP--glucose-1-phosphate uridylyltransferase|nr:UTP--glucose-1-phosphate uridylyltransferase GalU [Coxiellaceae bacterium]